MLHDFQGTAEIEAVRHPFVQGDPQLHHVPHLAGAVSGDLLRLVHGANGDHDGIGAVIVQMVVHAGALDTPQVGKEHAGKVGVILLQHSRHLPIEIQSFQPPEEKHQEEAVAKADDQGTGKSR